MRKVVAAIGAWIIYRLIWIFGRTHRAEDIAWLMGPLGGPTIGDATDPSSAKPRPAMVSSTSRTTRACTAASPLTS